MRTALSRGLRCFATSALTKLPKYYADVCTQKGPVYYDYTKHELAFGYLCALG